LSQNVHDRLQKVLVAHASSRDSDTKQRKAANDFQLVAQPVVCAEMQGIYQQSMLCCWIKNVRQEDQKGL